MNYSLSINNNICHLGQEIESNISFVRHLGKNLFIDDLNDLYCHCCLDCDIKKIKIDESIVGKIIRLISVPYRFISSYNTLMLLQIGDYYYYVVNDNNLGCRITSVPVIPITDISNIVLVKHSKYFYYVNTTGLFCVYNKKFNTIINITDTPIKHVYIDTSMCKFVIFFENDNNVKTVSVKNSKEKIEKSKVSNHVGRILSDVKNACSRLVITTDGKPKIITGMGDDLMLVDLEIDYPGELRCAHVKIVHKRTDSAKVIECYLLQTENYEIITYNASDKSYTITPNSYFADPSLDTCVKSARSIG